MRKGLLRSSLFMIATFAATFPALQTACAQAYLLPSPIPPTASCNAIVSHGSDAPETHSIDVSGATGTIEFQYNTEGIPDRMIVSIDGRPAFDSGCLGTNVVRSQRISLPPGAMKVQVRVQPNCSGDTGTSWSFKLVCPD
jgi:hypothetical protein